MNPFKAIASWWRGGTAQQVGTQSPVPGSYGIKSPATVTEDSALQVSAVWACVRLYAETIASLPIGVYKKTESGREAVEDHPLFRLLSRKPNARMTAIEFFETLILNLMLYGNFYAVIDRNSKGQVISLWPLASAQMDVKVLDDGSVVYLYNNGKDVAVFADASIVHVKLMGNGVVGLAPLAYARNAVGMAVAAESYGAAFYTNGGKPGAILTLDQVLTDDQRKQVRKNFSALVEGNENAHKLLVLEAGMKYTAVQMNPQDMQMLEQRRYQTEEIARFYAVPGALINDTEKTTTWGTGVEQIFLGWYQLSLRPMLKRIEAGFGNKLLSPAEINSMFIEFNFEGLLRGDSQGRADYLVKLVSNGLMTRNEGRKKENLPPVDGGDHLTVQRALMSLDELVKISEQPTGGKNGTTT